MYDYVKIVVNDHVFADELRGNPLLDFNTLVNEKTGAMKDDVHLAKYKNLEFIIYPSGRVEIKGSLHKYWNDGLHNWNDFSLRDVQSAIKSLQATFNINPNKTTVHNLEFGLNVNTDFNPNAFLDNLIAYKNEPFSKMKTRGQGNGKEVYLNQYGIKVYNKGLQYKQLNNILRIEKKVTKMECIGYGMVKLSDLLTVKFARHCMSQLLASFEQLIISDSVNKSALTKPELRLFTNCINPLNWGRMTKEERYKNRGRFNNLIGEYGEQKYKESIYKLLQEKGHLLTDILNTKKSLFDRSISRSERSNFQSKKLAHFKDKKLNYYGAFSIGDIIDKAYKTYKNQSRFKQVRKAVI